MGGYREEATVPQCVVLSDEVYKYIVHSDPRGEEKDGATTADAATDTTTVTANGGEEKTAGGVGGGASEAGGHVHFATLLGMWERTITISSAGKTFSATGWQVGWAVGPESLISPVHTLLPNASCMTVEAQNCT